ncbi:CBO0543 family protein [Lentibacillus songyuanensis]|uniref:CBO0543 family protein n=1 Tax=Lentibacillus songyuanensis TaxID=3136161 RepID=UPI0031B9EF55
MKHKFSVSVEELSDAQKHFFQVTYDRWLNDVLFTFNWWFLLVLMIVPLVIWWRLLDKTRTMEIAFYGLCIVIIAITLDVAGVVLSAWTYGYKLVQFFPPLAPVDFGTLPVLYMLIYQWVPRWKPFIFIIIFFAVFWAFIAEPIFIWMKIYYLNWWKYVYSFPIYIVMGIGIKALTEKVISLQAQQRREKKE